MVPTHGRGRMVLAYGMLLLGVLVFCTLTGYTGLNGQDAHDYLRIATAYSNWFHGASRPHMVEHPHGFPLAGAMVSKLMISDLSALRLLCAAGLLLVVVLVRQLLMRAFSSDARVDAFVLVGLALSPFLLRYSLIVLSDLPAIALMVMAFVFTCRWIDEGRIGCLLGAVVVAAMAVSVRFAVVPIIGILALAWIYGPARRRRTRLILGIVGSVVCILFLFIGMPPAGWSSLVVLRPVEDLSVINLFRRELISDDGVLHYRFPNLVYVLSIFIHPGFVPMGVLLLPFVRHADLKHTHAKLALIIAIGYLLFVGCMPFQNDRVLLMAQPFVVVLLFPAFLRAWDRVGSKGINMKWILTALVILQSGLFARATLPFAQQANVERELADLVNAISPQRVYTHGMGAAFKTYCPGVIVTELWYGELNAFDHGALIIVAPDNLEEQWQGRAPYTNWVKANAQGLVVIDQREDGWSIGKIR